MSPTMKVEFSGPLWLVQAAVHRFCGNHGSEAFHAPDGQEVPWSCELRNDARDCAWDGPFGSALPAKGHPNDPASATITIRIPPPKPSIPDLIASWRATFAPADREALWKAITGTGGYMVNGVRYLATQPCMGSDQRYCIEVS